MRAAFFTTIAWLALCCAAQAATVTTSQQKVFVNHGGGYHSVTGTVKVNAGDTVMAGPNGSAVITYDDGCKVTVDPGAVVAITAVSPCKLGLGVDDFAVGAAVIGGAVGAAILLSNDNGASP